MGAMDHRESDPGDDILCVWCHEPWPCTTAKVRRELAGHLRQVAADRRPSTLEESNYATGMELAADSIDYEGN